MKKNHIWNWKSTVERKNICKGLHGNSGMLKSAIRKEISKKVAKQFISFTHKMRH
jgi:hypothetical protein